MYDANKYDNNKLLILYNYMRFIVALNELYILLVLSPTHAPVSCSNSIRSDGDTELARSMAYLTVLLRVFRLGNFFL